MYCDACDRPTPAQPLPAGAVALKGLDLRTLRYFVVGGNQLDHPALNCRPTWTIAQGRPRQLVCLTFCITLKKFRSLSEVMEFRSAHKAPLKYQKFANNFFLTRKKWVSNIWFGAIIQRTVRNFRIPLSVIRVSLLPVPLGPLALLARFDLSTFLKTVNCDFV